MKALLLAAGVGSRLRPLTDILPKCLMPIRGYPLLGSWIDRLGRLKLQGILINLHHQQEVVELFLDEIDPEKSITQTIEPHLLGTAGTLAKNAKFFKHGSTLVIHADNLCICDLEAFVLHHRHGRPKNCAITMMTFHTNTPLLAGIVEVDEGGVVIDMKEKSIDAKGTLANAAIYIFEPEVIDWIAQSPNIHDISTQVLPHYMGRISAWQNPGIHLDIGNISNLRLAQEVNVNASTRKPLSQFFNNKISEIYEMLRSEAS